MLTFAIIVWTIPIICGILFAGYQWLSEYDDYSSVNYKTKTKVKEDKPKDIEFQQLKNLINKIV